MTDALLKVRNLDVTFDAAGGTAVSPPYVPMRQEDGVYAFVVDLSAASSWLLVSDVPFPRAVHFAVSDVAAGDSDPGYADNTGRFSVQIIPTRVKVPAPFAPLTLAMVQAVPGPGIETAFAIADTTSS